MAIRAIEIQCREDERNERPGGDATETVDYIFDVPLLLAASIVGYKHDESPIDSFELLDWHRPASTKPWWRFW
jgi:hypothetical protein